MMACPHRVAVPGNNPYECVRSPVPCFPVHLPTLLDGGQVAGNGLSYAYIQRCAIRFSAFSCAVYHAVRNGHDISADLFDIGDAGSVVQGEQPGDGGLGQLADIRLTFLEMQYVFCNIQ